MFSLYYCTNLLEVSGRVSFKVATEGSLRGQNTLKQKCRSATKKFEMNLVSDEFGFGKPCSTTYFLEVGARVSLKLATKGILGAKETLKIELLRLIF